MSSLQPGGLYFKFRVTSLHANIKTIPLFQNQEVTAIEKKNEKRNIKNLK